MFVCAKGDIIYRLYTNGIHNSFSKINQHLIPIPLSVFYPWGTIMKDERIITKRVNLQKKVTLKNKWPLFSKEATSLSVCNFYFYEPSTLNKIYFKCNTFKDTGGWCDWRYYKGMMYFKGMKSSFKLFEAKFRCLLLLFLLILDRWYKLVVSVDETNASKARVRYRKRTNNRLEPILNFALRHKSLGSLNMMEPPEIV